MLMPNFLIIGAAKAGTIALHAYLQQHPQIYMTPDKETNFFAFEGEKLNFQGPGDRAIAKFSITALDKYQAEFRGVKQERAIGEACPLYLYSSKAPAKIHHYLPKASLIVILRNPVDRAYANFLHLVRDDREVEKDFGRAIQLEPKRINDNWEWFWHYLQIGYYATQLARYYDLFPRERIKIYLYEDLQTDALKLVRDIFRFLEVEEDFIPDMSIRPNKSGMPKNPLLHQFLTKPNPLKSLLKPLFPQSMRQKIQHENLITPKLTSEIREQLKQVYREEILACQDLIERNLSSWL
jgi:hypothetical protein